MVAEVSHEDSPEPFEIPVTANNDVAETVPVEQVANVPHRDSQAQSNPKPVSCVLEQLFQTCI
jgi:hypothetical protein